VPAARADYLFTYVTDNLTDKQPYLQSLPMQSPLSNRSLTPQTSGQILETYDAPPSGPSPSTRSFFAAKKSAYIFTPIRRSKRAD
jgi:hypothetical protein